MKEFELKKYGYYFKVYYSAIEDHEDGVIDPEFIRKPQCDEVFKAIRYIIAKDQMQEEEIDILLVCLDTLNFREMLDFLDDVEMSNAGKEIFQKYLDEKKG